MKNVYMMICTSILMMSGAIAQTPCDAGRYSTELFPTVTVTSDINFGTNTTFTGATATLDLDVYEPTGDTETERPLIIWAHGGSFIGGSKTDADVVTLSNAFAKRGYVCASIDYRLGMFPIDSVNAVKAVVRAVQDMKAAIRFFYKDKQTTDTYKIDTNNIIVAGSSAGAITALHLAYLDQECEVEQYISTTTLNNMGGLEGTSGNPGYSTNVHAVVSLAGALASYGWLEAGDLPVCSLQGDDDGTVPYNRGVASVSGFNVIWMDGSRMIKEQADVKGVPNRLYTHYGADHAPYAFSAAYMDTTINFVTDFLVDYLGCSEPVTQAENAPTGAANLYQLTYCGLGINETEEATLFELYPNPSENVIQINVLTSTELKTIEVVDLMGRVIHSVDPKTNIIQLMKNDYGAGTFILKMTDVNGNIATEKFIFQ